MTAAGADGHIGVLRRAGAIVPLLVVLAGGCYSYTKVRVHVVDAAGGRSVKGAVVQTDYERTLMHPGPWSDRRTTDAGGIAMLCVARDPEGIVFIVEAPGYDPAYLGVYPPETLGRSGPEWKPVEWPPAPQTILLSPRATPP